jgi:hypothetical protein
MGRRWSKLTALFPGRTAIAIRNHCCKLARQKNSDPVLKAVLHDNRRKRIRLDLTDARDLTPSLADDGESILPSCLTMLVEASVAKDATYLYPVTTKFSKSQAAFPEDAWA